MLKPAKTNRKTKMKFKYKYKNYLYWIFGAIYALSVVCFVWNLYRLVISLENSLGLLVYDYISIALCLALPVAFAAFTTAAIASSYYLVKDNEIKVAFGFLSDKYKINEIDSLVKNIRNNTLVIVFNDESTLNVIISPDKFDDFCSEIIKLNRKVSYEQTDDGNK